MQNSTYKHFWGCVRRFVANNSGVSLARADAILDAVLKGESHPDPRFADYQALLQTRVGAHLSILD